MWKRKERSRGPRPKHVRPEKSRQPSIKSLHVLFEDDAVIVVNKPAGLPTVPIKGKGVPSAVSLLTLKLRSKNERPLIVHRIDRFTSGIVLFAKTERDREVLIEQFLAHQPKREYLAVVRRKLQQRKGKLVHYLRRREQHQIVSSNRDPKATRAVLHYSVEKDFRDSALVRVSLETGLQNQIRVQFSAIGHPVIGDRKYQRKESREPDIQRVALHAAKLTFKHPRTGEQITITSNPPDDFENLLRRLDTPDKGRRLPRPAR